MRRGQPTNSVDIESLERGYSAQLIRAISDAMNLLANLLSENGEPDEAEKWYRQAVELGNADAVYNLALLHHEYGRLADVERWQKTPTVKQSTPAIPGLLTTWVRCLWIAPHRRGGGMVQDRC